MIPFWTPYCFFGSGIKIKTCWEMFDDLTLTICTVFYIQVFESLAKDIKYNLSKLAIFFQNVLVKRKVSFRLLVLLTLPCIIVKNGQTYSRNSSAPFSPLKTPENRRYKTKWCRRIVWVWPFCGVSTWRVKQILKVRYELKSSSDLNIIF